MPTKPNSKRPRREPERVKFHGNWEDLAARMVNPAGKAPERQTKKRRKRP